MFPQVTPVFLVGLRRARHIACQIESRPPVRILGCAGNRTEWLHCPASLDGGLV
jgi:hypothetical protein